MEGSDPGKRRHQTQTGGAVGGDQVVFAAPPQRIDGIAVLDPQAADPGRLVIEEAVASQVVLAVAPACNRQAGMGYGRLVGLDQVGFHLQADGRYQADISAAEAAFGLVGGDGVAFQAQQTAVIQVGIQAAVIAADGGGGNGSQAGQVILDGVARQQHGTAGLDNIEPQAAANAAADDLGAGNPGLVAGDLVIEEAQIAAFTDDAEIQAGVVVDRLVVIELVAGHIDGLLFHPVDIAAAVIVPGPVVVGLVIPEGYVSAFAKDIAEIAAAAPTGAVVVHLVAFEIQGRTVGHIVVPVQPAAPIRGNVVVELVVEHPGDVAIAQASQAQPAAIAVGAADDVAADDIVLEDGLRTVIGQFADTPAAAIAVPPDDIAGDGVADHLGDARIGDIAHIDAAAAVLRTVIQHLVAVEAGGRTVVSQVVHIDAAALTIPGDILLDEVVLERRLGTVVGEAAAEMDAAAILVRPVAAQDIAVEGAKGAVADKIAGLEDAAAAAGEGLVVQELVVVNMFDNPFRGVWQVYPAAIHPGPVGLHQVVGEIHPAAIETGAEVHAAAIFAGGVADDLSVAEGEAAQLAGEIHIGAAAAAQDGGVADEAGLVQEQVGTFVEKGRVEAAARSAGAVALEMAAAQIDQRTVIEVHGAAAAIGDGRVAYDDGIGHDEL